MGTRKCGCIYSDDRNSRAIRKGFEVSGSIMKFCDKHKQEISDSMNTALRKSHKKVVSKKAHLEGLAGTYCVGIFNDFDESEIKQQPPSIQGAWNIGENLTDLDT